MKRKNKIIALLSVAALCLSLFAGCSRKTDDDAETENTADSVITQDSETTGDSDASGTEDSMEDATEGEEETIENFVVEVVSVDGAKLELKQYNAISEETVVEDYIDVDFSLFEATEHIFKYSIYEKVSIVLVEDGAAVETTADEIAPGDMLVFFVTEDGQGIIAIHHPIAEDAAE